MNKSYALSDLVDVFTGVTVTKDSGYECFVLSVGSLADDYIDYDKGATVEITTKKASYIQMGDVLFVNRGAFSVSLVDEDLPHDKVSVPSFVFILRPNQGISSEFLYWYLNSSTSQNMMKKLNQGSAIRFISKNDLMRFKIPIPPKHIQNTISRIYKLHCHRQLKQKQRMDLQETYIQHTLEKIVKGYLT